MKKFNTDEYGLLPIWLSDAEFMQTASQELIEALIKPWLEYTDDNAFIVSGIEENPEVSNGYTSGWIVLEGKMYYVDAFVSAPEAGTVRRWTIGTEYLPTGTKTPKRTTTPVETHVQKNGIVTVYPSSMPILPGHPFDLPRINNIINNMRQPEYFTRHGEGYRLQFVKLAIGYVHMYGTLAPDMIVIGDPAQTCDITIPFPYVLDADFKDGFDCETMLTVYTLNSINFTHNAIAFRCWLSLVPLEAFTLRISPEETVPYGYSEDHKSHIDISVILKLK